MSAATFATEAAPSAVDPGRLRQLWRNPNGLLGLITDGVPVVIGGLAAVGLTPHPPLQQGVGRFVAPGAEHWLGTDQFGRDVASRIMMGVLASLRVAVLAVAISAVIGSVAGIAAGFFGGWVDRVIGRVTDTLFAFPAILLALTIVAVLGRGWINTVIAIAIVFTPIFVRVARGPVLTVRELDFVKAGRVLGYGPGRLLSRHVLPNVTAPIVVQIALALSWAILTESSLSFLGLGIQPPTPSWGNMLFNAQTYLWTNPLIAVFPGAFIFLTLLSLNFLGDGFRDALDPRLRRRQR